MDVHGFQVLSEPSDNPQSDGHSTTVVDARGVIRGPFFTVRDAIQCAEDWRAEQIQEIEDTSPTEPTEGDEQTN
jgi:hypothetical protein